MAIFLLANLSRTRPARTAFTLVEVSVAMLILTLFLGGLFEASGQLLRLLTAQKETVASGQAFQERMEAVRALPYARLTDAAYLRDHLLDAPTASAAGLPDPVETVTLAAFPPDGTPATRVRRAPGGAATLESVNPDLPAATAVRVDLQLVWQTRGGRERQRVLSTVVAKGGIAP